MTERSAGTRDSAILSKLVAGQAQAEAQFKELFRRLDRAENTAGEARDSARELVTILREQDTGARIVELRNELRASQSEMRQDFVAANTRLRSDLEAEAEARRANDAALGNRLASIEQSRAKVIGAASFFGWLAKHTPWLFAIAMAALAGIGLKPGAPS